MRNHKIINQLIEDPLKLYSSKEFRQSAEFRKKVSEAEELLLGAIFQLKTDSISNDSSIGATSMVDENEYAQKMDQVESGKYKGNISKSKSLFNGYIDHRIMKKKSGQWYNVPEGLMAYISRSLDYEESLQGEKGIVPGFAVNLFKDGLSVIKSSLHGFDLLPQPVVQVRKAGTNAGMPPSIRLNHSSGTAMMQINLVIEENHHLGLSLKFRQPLTGRISLRAIESGNGRNSRILDSSSMDNKTSLHFPGIQRGAYIIHLQPNDQKLAFVVH